MITALNKQRRQLLPTALPEGSIVNLVDPLRANKWEPKYVGPYTIVRRAQHGAYVLRDAAGDILDRHVPADQLKLLSKRTRRRDQSAPTYEIDRVLDHRGNPGAYEYLVQWKGYGADDNTWEPASNFHDNQCIQSYWRQLKASLAQ